MLKGKWLNILALSPCPINRQVYSRADVPLKKAVGKAQNTHRSLNPEKPLIICGSQKLIP
jgi:hypothetical protein